MKIFCTDCDLTIHNTRDLPYNTYVVEYVDEDRIKYDIVQVNKQVEIFNHYWDNYREGLKKWWQSEGRINPKLWDSGSDKKKKRG